MDKSFTLSFGKISKIQNNLAEVIVDANIEFNMDMIAEYHDWLLTNLERPFAILINKLNPYAYSFEAQMNIANLPEIKAMAVVSYSKVTEESTNILISLPRKAEWNIRIFEERTAALNWLQSELTKA